MTLPLLNIGSPDKESNVWDWAVERGKAFAASDAFPVSGGGGTHDVVFIVPPDANYVAYIRVIAVKGQYNGFLDIYIGDYPADISIVTSGTRVPSLNKYVKSPTTSPIIIEHGGTYSLNVTEHTRGFITGGIGRFATGGGFSFGLAGRVDPGSAVLLRITNLNTSDGYFDTRFEYWIDELGGTGQ